MTSRAFNQDVSHAKRLALDQPLVVTDRGRATHVLLSIAAYRQLADPGESLLDQLALNDSPGVDPDWRAATRWSR